MQDWECLSFGETRYRITSFALTEASTYVLESVFADSPAVWLSGGGSFEKAARLPFNPEKSINVSRDRGMHRFAGRSRAVAWSGIHTSRSVDLQGILFDQDELVASPEWLEEVALDPSAVHMYRDPRGERMYGQLGELDLERGPTAETHTFGVQVEETERG